MKGQAAIEYLTTYGWAILALVIVIAVLFSTGIFSPSYLVSEECNFGNSLQCQFALFNEGGHTKIQLTVFNGFPYKVRLDDLSIVTLEGGQAFTGFAGGIELESGAQHTFEGELGGPAIPEGQIKRFGGNMTYVSCAPELGPACSDVEHTITGRVTGRVIPE
ncbi:MAG: hypothetical protein AB1529_05200 [Candidatus Micrarchaeota archaeon]